MSIACGNVRFDAQRQGKAQSRRTFTRVAQHFFPREIVGTDEGALLQEHVAGACCGSKLPRVYRPLMQLWFYLFPLPRGVI